jgi:hypothetical protein
MTYFSDSCPSSANCNLRLLQWFLLTPGCSGISACCLTHSCCVSRLCCVSHLQLSTLANMHRMLTAAGMSPADLMLHCAFLWCWMFEEYAPGDWPQGRFVLLADMSGLKLAQAVGEGQVRKGCSCSCCPACLPACDLWQQLGTDNCAGCNWLAS